MRELETAAGAPDFEDRLAGVLLGTALGDALGLPAENLSPHTIARRFADLERFHMLGRTGFVSDDTEQSALVAQSLVREPADAAACADRFGRALLGWFLRLPWGIGFATLRACLKRLVGWRPSGVMSAGNGAAMRIAVAGVFHRDAAERARFAHALTTVTHRDPRAVDASLFVAELAGRLSTLAPDAPVPWHEARALVTEPVLAAALDRAAALAGAPAGVPGTPGASVLQMARELGTSGYVVHTVPFAFAVFLRYADRPLLAMQEAVRAGGDTDSIAAIVGALAGARHGARGLPAALIADLHDGPFGPSHLRALASALARRGAGAEVDCPVYSAAFALIRNLALMPVILGHLALRLVR